MHTRIRSCVPHVEPTPDDEDGPAAGPAAPPDPDPLDPLARPAPLAPPAQPLCKQRELLGLERRVGFGGRVDDDDLVSALNERLRNDLCRGLPEHAPHELLLLGDVLEIDRRDDRNARLDELFDILVTPGVPAPGRIVVRQTVDETHLRMARNEDGHVDDRDAGRVTTGDHIHRADDRYDAGRDLRLRGRNHHILAAVMPPAPFVEQLERLADARGVAEKDLELPTPCRPLGGFELAKQRLRIPRRILRRTCVAHAPGILASTSLPSRFSTKRASGRPFP